MKSPYAAKTVYEPGAFRQFRQMPLVLFSIGLSEPFSTGRVSMHITSKPILSLSLRHMPQ
jgi:hypothetical protein